MSSQLNQRDMCGVRNPDRCTPLGVYNGGDSQKAQRSVHGLSTSTGTSTFNPRWLPSRKVLGLLPPAAQCLSPSPQPLRAVWAVRSNAVLLTPLASCRYFGGLRGSSGGRTRSRSIFYYRVSIYTTHAPNRAGGHLPSLPSFCQTVTKKPEPTAEDLREQQDM